jgi:multiple sugar transport system substrate-binding protein
MYRSQQKVRRLAFVALSLLMLMSLLVACGGAATTPAEPAAGGTTEEAPAAGGATEETAVAAEPTVDLAAAPAGTPVPTALPEITCEANQRQIVWMVRNGEPENSWEFDVVLPAFKAAQPEICVVIQSFVQDDIAVRREAMIAAGEPLHVWSTNWGGDGFASDRARGLIIDLTPLIERDSLDLSVFVPSVLEIYQAEGKTYGLPFLTTGTYVYYNKEIFDAAGVAYPPTDWDDDSWTWDKFVEVGKQLTKDTDDINKAQFGALGTQLNLEGPPMMFGNTVWSEEAYETGFSEPVNVTDDASVNAYQALHDLVYEHKIAPDPAAASALDQLGGAFAAGRVGMAMSGGWGHWAWRDLIDDEAAGFCWGVAPLPKGSPDADIRAVIYTDPWVITRNLPADQQDDAWTFLKFLVSPEQAKIYSDTTGTPPTQTALLEDYYKQYEKCMDPADMKAVFEGAFTHGRESSNHMLVRWDELNQIWVNSFSSFFNDPEGEARPILEDVQQQTNEALERIKSEGVQ